MQAYGIDANQALVSLRFGGLIRTGLSGAAKAPVATATNSGTVGLMIADPKVAFRRYFFRIRVGGDVQCMGTAGQGYRIDEISGSV